MRLGLKLREMWFISLNPLYLKSYSQLMVVKKWTFWAKSPTFWSTFGKFWGLFGKKFLSQEKCSNGL